MPCPAQREISKYQWPLERIFGRRNWCITWLAELCAANDRLFMHITEQRQDYIHFLCFVRLALLELNCSAVSIAYQAEWLLKNSKRKILSDLYNTVPEGLIGILSRLGPHALPERYYQLILEMLSDNTARKYLTHKKRIFKRDLDLLPFIQEKGPGAASADWARDSKVYARIMYYTKVTQAIHPELPREQIVKSLLKFKRQEQFCKWINKQLLSVNFPAPFWAGNAWLHPVTTAAELKSTARTFKNCCYAYLANVLYERSYFYVSEEGPAVIMLVRDAFLGWEIDEINGIANEKVLPHPKARILNAFASAGIPERREFRWHDGLDDFLI